MAKALASRAPSDEAFQERLERAAARFPSIHDRWSAVSSNSAPEASLSAGSLPAAGTAEPPSSPLPISESGVCVTPILGIATDAEEEPRPRFKTLMGVPRDTLEDHASEDEASEADEGSGAPATLESSRDGASAPGDDASPKRPAPPPLPSRFLGLQEAARSNPAAPALADTHARVSATSPQVRSVPPHWGGLGQSSTRVGADVAKLRRSQRRRSWLVGMASFAATLAVFAVIAPRERELAARWLQEEYQGLVRPSLHTVADTARALKPSSLVGSGGADEEARALAMSGGAAAPQRIEERPAPEAEAPRPDLTIDTPTTTAAPSTEVASEPRSAPQVESLSPPASDLGAQAVAAEETEQDSAGPPRRAAKTRATRTKSPVAAPRKRSTRTATTAAADMKARATASPTASSKERAARQNSSRRGGNGGIIRETPF